MDKSVISSIPVLTGKENYREWASKVKAAAFINGIWLHYISEDLVWNTISAEGQEDRKERVKEEDLQIKEMKAQGIILLTVSSIITIKLESLSDDATANTMWTLMKELFSTRDGVTAMLDMKKFQRVDFVDDGNMEFQIDSFTELRSHCTLNKHTVTDWQFAAMLLIALPDSFSHVQDAFLTTGDPQDLSPDTVHAKILEFENRKKEQATGSAAFSFSTTTTKSKGKKATTSSSSTLAAASDKSNVECFYCKKKGHMAKVCRTKKQDKAKEKQEAEKKNQKSGPGPANTGDKDPNTHQAHAGYIGSTDNKSLQCAQWV